MNRRVTPVPAAWAELIDHYLIAIAGAGQRTATVRLRREQLELIACGLQGTPQDVTAAKLLAWFGTRTWAPATRKSHRDAAIGFFRWAAHDGHVETDFSAELPRVRIPKPQPRPAPDDVWTAALLVADTRVQLMIRLAGEAGLRRAEVASVHSRNVTDGPSLVVDGKGGKRRVVPISEELAGAIRSTEGWLFPSRKGGHMTPREVGRLVADALAAGWSMHTLRHRFATRAYRGSRNLRAVQVLMGHSSIATTERYLACDDSEIRAAMLSAV